MFSGCLHLSIRQLFTKVRRNLRSLLEAKLDSVSVKFCTRIFVTYQAWVLVKVSHLGAGTHLPTIRVLNLLRSGGARNPTAMRTKWKMLCWRSLSKGGMMPINSVLLFLVLFLGKKILKVYLLMEMDGYVRNLTL